MVHRINIDTCTQAYPHIRFRPVKVCFEMRCQGRLLAGSRGSKCFPKADPGKSESANVGFPTPTRNGRPRPLAVTGGMGNRSDARPECYRQRTLIIHLYFHRQYPSTTHPFQPHERDPPTGPWGSELRMPTRARLHHRIHPTSDIDRGAVRTPGGRRRRRDSGCKHATQHPERCGRATFCMVS